MSKEKVLDFWFSELEPSNWFQKSDALDEKIKSNFESLFIMASRGELFSWRESIEGRLAEIIVLDQFSRNMYRNSYKAFEFDTLALVLSQEASHLKEAKELPAQKRAFLYMPYMHSESLLVHEEALVLFSEPGLENNLEYEVMHKKIIERFGRYPHRNQILGRESSKEELEFLKGPNSSF